MAERDPQSPTAVATDDTSLDNLEGRIVLCANKLLEGMFHQGLLTNIDRFEGIGFSIGSHRFLFTATPSMCYPAVSLAQSDVELDAEVKVDSFDTIQAVIDERVTVPSLFVRRKLVLRGCLSKLHLLGEQFQNIHPDEMKTIISTSLDGSQLPIRLPPTVRTNQRNTVTAALWVPDEKRKSCIACRRQFTMFRRRHHCRECGELFCNMCAPRPSPLCSTFSRRATCFRICYACRYANGLRTGGFPADTKTSKDTEINQVALDQAWSNLSAMNSQFEEALRINRETRLHHFVAAADLVGFACLAIVTLAPSVVCFFAIILLGWERREVQVFAMLALTWIACVVYHYRRPDSLWKRRACVTYNFLVIFLRFHWTMLCCRNLEKGSHEYNMVWESNHSDVAFYYYRKALLLKGIWVKSGQMVSTRKDMMPDPYLYWLEKLQDQTEEAPLKDVQQTLLEDLGPELFKTLSVETKPLGCASVAQVHRATCNLPELLGTGLQNPRNVVVKVQHRGIVLIMKQDLESLGIIIKFLAWLEPAMDVMPFLDEWREASTRELNFADEARSQERAREFLATTSLQNRIVIPKVHTMFTQKRTIVMDYVDGVSIKNVAEAIPDRKNREEFAATIVDAFAAQILVDGHFNADPHPGNVLIERETLRPVLLDWGLTKTFNQKTRIAYAQMLYATDTRDVWLLTSALEDMGFNFSRDEQRTSEGTHIEPMLGLELMRLILRDPLPRSEFRPLLDQRIELDSKKMAHDKGMKRKRPPRAISGEILFFIRAIDCLQGLASGFGVCIPFLPIFAHRTREVLTAHAKLTAALSMSRSPASASSSSSPVAVRGPMEEKLYALLHEFAKNGLICGAQICVTEPPRGRELVWEANVAYGQCGPLTVRAVEEDTLFITHGLGQLPLTLLLLSLLDEGAVKLNEPLCKTWKTFNNKDVTLGHVLARTTGLWHVFPEQFTLDRLLNLDEVLKALEEATPIEKAGSAQCHHYWTYGWLIAGICRHIMGQELPDCWEHYLGRICDEPTMNEIRLTIGDDDVNIATSTQRSHGRVQAQELSNALMRLSLEMEEELDDVGKFLQPLTTREHFFDLLLYNEKSAKNAISLCGQGVRASARGLARLLANAVSGSGADSPSLPIPARNLSLLSSSTSFTAQVFKENDVSTKNIKSPIAVKVDSSLADVPPLLYKAVMQHRQTEPSSRSYRVAWPEPGNFSALGLQHIGASPCGRGIGGIASESGSFTFWFPEATGGTTGSVVSLVTNRTDALECGLGEAVLNVVAECLKLSPR